jgi:hypothetical protein
MEPTAEASSRASPARSSRRFPLSDRTGGGGRALALAIGTGLALVVFQVQLVGRALTVETFRNDFRLYVGAARLGLGHGYSHVYDLDLQRQAVDALFPRANYQPFVSPPLDAWLATPLAGLPFSAGLVVWTVFLGSCVLLTWLLIAPGWGADRIAHLLLAVGFLPLGFAVSVGQLAPVIGLSIAVSYVLLRRGRPELAGVALLAVWLKPQTAILVAPALLVAGQRRTFVSWLLASAAVGLVTAATLGAHGIAAYRSALLVAGQWDLMRRFSLPGQPFWGFASPGVSLVVAAVTLVLARRHRHDLGMVMAAGLAGSLMFSPYLGVQDLSLLVPAAWLAWQGRLSAWHLALSAAVYAVLECSLLLGPGPVLVAEVTWLGSLWLLPVAPGPAAPTPGIARPQMPPALLPAVQPGS